MRYQGIHTNRRPIAGREKPHWGTRINLHCSTSSKILTMLPITDMTLLQVKRAFFMHSTGHFIKDNCPFPEKFWGHQMAIYVKLTKGLSSSKWDGFNGTLAFAQGFQDKLKECSKPVKCWTDDPDEYFIIVSDPAKPAE